MTESATASEALRRDLKASMASIDAPTARSVSELMALNSRCGVDLDRGKLIDKWLRSGHKWSEREDRRLTDYQDVKAWREAAGLVRHLAVVERVKQIFKRG